jgi:hypothetical protein
VLQSIVIEAQDPTTTADDDVVVSASAEEIVDVATAATIAAVTHTDEQVEVGTAITGTAEAPLL